jgi:hypothetical protein
MLQRSPRTRSETWIFTRDCWDCGWCTKAWGDTDQTKVESFVPDCVASMMKIAVEYRRNTAKRQQEELFRKLHWVELRQLKAQIDAEVVRFE